MEIKSNGKSFFTGDSSVIGEARRYAQNLIPQIAGHDLIHGRVGVVITELGTNLIKYGERGVLFIRELDHALEILAIDSGKGFRDLTHSLRDGSSSGSSMGTGLGAIQRQSDEFDIYTDASGTVVISVVYFQPRENDGPLQSHGQGHTSALFRGHRISSGSTESPFHFDFGCVSAALSGESQSGDTWTVSANEDLLTVALFDGLGHGLMAHEASSLACELTSNSARRTPTEILQTLHVALRSTRGAAGSIFQYHTSRPSEIHFSGIGNVGGVIANSQKSQNMVTFNGTLGVQVRSFKNYTSPLPADAVLVLHSDGLSSRWALADYPGLIQRSASCIAGVLFRDQRRSSDDATIVVVKFLRERESQ